MSTFPSTIDALISWEIMDKEITVFDPAPLPSETRTRMKAISAYLSAQCLTINLAETMTVLWSAIGNVDSPPSMGDLQNSLLQCSEAAWLIARVAAAEDSIRFRLGLADQYDVMHSNQEQTIHPPATG